MIKLKPYQGLADIWINPDHVVKLEPAMTMEFPLQKEGEQHTIITLVTGVNMRIPCPPAEFLRLLLRAKHGVAANQKAVR